MKTTVKTDLYTKVILTVIAVCLTVGLLKDFQIITPAHASAPVTSIAEETQKQTKSKKEVIDVNIVQMAGTKIYWGNGLPVRVENK